MSIHPGAIAKRPFFLAGLIFHDPRHEAFVHEYLKDFSGSHAAIRAGYTPGAAANAAARLLKEGSTAIAIARARAARNARIGVNPERVLHKLGQMLMGDPRAIFNEDGTLKPPSAMNADDAQLIAGVKTRRTIELDEDGKVRTAEIQEIKVVDQTALLSLAMRHLGMLNDKLDVNVTSLSERMRNAMQRTGAVDVEPDNEEIESRITPIMENALEYHRSNPDVLVAGRPDLTAEYLDEQLQTSDEWVPTLAQLLGDEPMPGDADDATPLVENGSAWATGGGAADDPPRPSGPMSAQVLQTPTHEKNSPTKSFPSPRFPNPASYEVEEDPIDLAFLLS